MNKIKHKNPIITALLSFFLGPIGFLNIGWTFMISGIILSVIFSIVIYYLPLPIPYYFNYIQLFIYAWFGYKLAKLNNLFVNEFYVTEEDVSDLKSFSFSFVIMSNLLGKLVQYYALIVGGYIALINFSEGNIFMGIIILIFGITLIQWLLSVFFSFILFTLSSIFRIDPKYFQK